MFWFISILLIITGIFFILKINTSFEYHYYDNGKVKSLGKTRFGKRIGEFKYFDKNEYCYCIQKYSKGKIAEEQYYLKGASNEILENREIVFNAVKNDGNNLQYIAKALRCDRQVVFEAVKSKKFAKNYVSPDRYSKLNQDHLRDIFTFFSNDTELFQHAVNKNGLLLEFASSEIQDNDEVVLSAVIDSGTAIQYASQRLRSNKKIIVPAVYENSKALYFIDREFRHDNEVIEAAIYDYQSNFNNGYLYRRQNIVFGENELYGIYNASYPIAPINLIPPYKLVDKNIVFNRQGIWSADRQKLTRKISNLFSLLVLVAILPGLLTLIMIPFIWLGYKKIVYDIFGRYVDLILALGVFGTVFFSWIVGNIKSNRIFGPTPEIRSIRKSINQLCLRILRLKNKKSLMNYLDKEEFSAIQYAVDELKYDQNLILEVIAKSEKVLILAYVEESLKRDKDFNQKLKPYILKFLTQSKNQQEKEDFYYYWFLGNEHLYGDTEMLELIFPKKD
jgi:hypothetical protein